MPKDDIDYSNTIIYKIFCSDKTITDVYVGHTTNFTKRKYQHKISSGNLDNKLKIYNIIRQNGGWNNWNMIEISKYNCKDKTEARIKELYHYEELNSTLNSCPPWVDKSKNFCSICNLQCKTLKSYETHIICSLHKKNLTEKTKKNEKKYSCNTCDYYTSSKKDNDKHLFTSKHKRLTNTNGFTNENPNKSHDDTIFLCKCGKLYKHMSSLCKHKIKCCLKETTENTIFSSDVTDKELIFMLLKQNTQLIEQNAELVKNIAKEVVIEK